MFRKMAGIGPVVLICAVLAACGGTSSAPKNTDPVPDSNSGSGTGTGTGTGTGNGPGETSTPPGGESPDTGPETPPEPPATDLLKQALSSGDASLVASADTLIDAALDTIDEGRTAHTDSIIELFNLQDNGDSRDDGSSISNISWNPTHDAAVLGPVFGRNAVLLRTNAVFVSEYDIQEKTIAVIGRQPARNIVMGSNPMRNAYRNSGSVNDDMHQLMINSIAWLANRDLPLTESIDVVISHMSDSYYFPDETAVRNWLDEKFPGQLNYNSADSCDDASLHACLAADPDLLIISQVMSDATEAGSIASTVEQAMERGTAVLYLHHDGGITTLGEQLFKVLGVSYLGDNYWKKLALQDFAISQTLAELPAEISSIETMLKHFKAKDYNFDWTQCDGENCDSVPGLQSDFLDAAQYTKQFLNNLDTQHHDLFGGDDLKLYKLLVLIGDHFRQSVVYPMDKNTTDDTRFMQAYFADHAVHYYRSKPATAEQRALDLGNFSRSDFSHITPTNKDVQFQSKRTFRAAGVYALPGQTFTVTRNDNNDLAVKVFVNTLRSGSTHQWADNGYNRPKFLQSPRIEIKPAQRIAITSPYGGPVQVEFDQNDLNVELMFENIGQHPYWNSSADDEGFAQKLETAEFDWAEIASPGFEVHSTLEKMKESMVDPALDINLPPAQAISAATMRYVHNYPHVLAGFQGQGIDVVPEIHDFASARNLSIDTLDKVKHMNADQATCGYGCSGNPYDAYWSFSPVGHGDIHELGHGLQKNRIRFEGWETHTMTNMYSYYTKMQFHKETNKDSNCQSLPFRESFDVLQQSLLSSEPAAYVKTNLWQTMGWSEGAAMFIQMMMLAQDSSALADGWHLLPRLHILDREFARAIKSDEAAWQTRRSDLGFSEYSLAQAKDIGSNDWLLVSVSTAVGLDFRDYFDVWALPYSAAAASQVAAFSYTPAPLRYFVSSAKGYCDGEGFDGRSVPLDGVGGWPVGG